MIAGLPCIWGLQKHHCATYLLSFLSGTDNPSSRYHPCRARSQGSYPWQAPVRALGVSHSSRIFLWPWARLSGIPYPSV